MAVTHPTRHLLRAKDLADARYADPLTVGDLAQAIASLPEREKLLIALYYHENMTLREIGDIICVSESRACQLHAQAILRLRGKLSQ